MATVLLDDVVHTDFGQFDLVWDDEDSGFDGDPERYFDGQVNGLVGASSGTGAYLVLGRRSGGSRVCIELVDDAPARAPEDHQDDVEVSITVPEGARVRWLSWACETSGRLALPAGSYRMRVSARGRDAGAAGEFATEVLDAYLLQLWPAPWRPDEVLRSGSADGRYWHESWGGNR